jgi:dynein heavy chain
MEDELDDQMAWWMGENINQLEELTKLVRSDLSVIKRLAVVALIT